MVVIPAPVLVLCPFRRSLRYKLAPIATFLLVMSALTALGQTGATAPPTRGAPSTNKVVAPSNTSRSAIFDAPPKLPSNSSRELEAVLSQLDKASETFHSTHADFVWNQYQKVVDETDVQKGSIYFVRGDKGTQMAADISVPDKKYVVFTDGKLKLYQPRIEQLTEYDAGKNRSDLESFLVLGFGSRGHDLVKAFDAKFDGYETLDNTRVAKLSMLPKSQRVRNIFESVTLWIDPVRGVSLKQQFFEPSGDYRIATYGNFKLNPKVPPDVFKLKITSRTKIIRPQ